MKKMNKKYEAPPIEVFEIQSTMVLMASGGAAYSGNPTGGGSRFSVIEELTE